ncbi:MAG: hypothetical protein JWO97_1791 [Acidobacteria bacterium]|nr:hypothetical protein [Acidobacteriota bacterium]
MIVLALLLLLATEPTQATGDLVVQVAAGTEVYVDGQMYGVASTDGQTVRGLAAGPHKVMLHAPNGGTATFNVNIIEAKVQTINVSPLGFRMKPKSETPVAAVRIVSDETPCTVSVGDVSAEKTQHELNVGTVPTGRQKLSIVCGTKRVDSMLTLAPDELQIIEPDFNRHVANVLGHRRRVTALVVEGGQSEIVSANIPVEWKRALSAAAGESKAINVTPISGNTVLITYRAPTMNGANAVIDRLRNTDIVDRAEPTGNAQKTPDGVVFTVRVKFRVAGMR